MQFLTPWWLLALVSLPLIFILYVIRSRYRYMEVASVMLWRGVPRDLVAHTAWRRPKWELLLLLQLFASLLAIVAIGRPAISASATSGLVIVLDVSASMRAQDVSPTRFDAARREVAALSASAAAEDWVALITAGARPHIVSEGPAADVIADLDTLHAEDGPGDMAAAIRMASGLAASRSNSMSQVVVVTDGAFAFDASVPPQPAAISFRLVGGQGNNVAVSLVSLRRPLEAGRPVAGFANAVNFGTDPVTAPLIVFADGLQVDSREITIPARGRVEITFEVPGQSRDVAVQVLAPDALPADNRVQLNGPAHYQRPVLVVSDDPALWGRVLDAVPYVTWRAALPAEYDASQLTPDSIVIFERFAPSQLPTSGLILVDPPAPLVTPSDTTRPGHAVDIDRTTPLLRGLDIAPLNAARVTPIAAPAWASIDVADSQGTPLLLHGMLDGRRTVLLPFDPAASNLGQMAAFPLLVTNVVDWLTPGRGEEMHAGPGSKADIAPQPDSVLPIPADPQSALRALPAFELWPAVVALALGLVVVEWLLAARSAIGLRKPGGMMLLRVACVACLAIALTRPSIKVSDDAMNVVFALDTSEARQAASAWLGSALDARHTNDQSSVVTVPVSDADSGATDLGLGLRLAAGLVRHSAGRVVLLSDGREPTGDLDAALAEVADVPIDVVPLNAHPIQTRVGIDALNVPPFVRAGEAFDATAVLGATQPTSAILHISIDGQPTRDEVVQLTPGLNRVTISQTLASEGFHRLSVRVDAQAGVELTNDMADGFVVVKPAPRVLIVEERHGEGTAMQSALGAAALSVEVRTPDQLPGAGQLEDYAALVLANVSATSFTLDQQKLLRSYVETNGHGLLVLGGSTSYGLGGYADSVLEAALPVTSTVPPKREDARMALLLIVDNSQSMIRKSDGVSSMQMAKEAAILAMQSLDDRDQIGVLSFNHRFQWLVEMGTVGQIGRQNIQERIARLEPEGGTEIFTALSEGATAMLATHADLRHIILFTDGQSRPADYDQLTARLRAAKIGLSTIGLGPEADTQLLSSLAKLGEGRYYFTERIPELPRIMTREVAISKRSTQIEGTIQPQLRSTSPILRGVAPSDMPQLSGYIATTPRDVAQVVLATEDDRPLLSQWHFGLGRVAAWTSDTGSVWASGWSQWVQGPRVWEQAARWTMGSPTQRDFQVSARTSGQQADITLETVRDARFADLEDPTASITGPSGLVAVVPLRQRAPGRYTARVTAATPGAYEVSVTTHPQGKIVPRSETTGFVLRTISQSSTSAADEHVLRRIASETGGRLLADPASAFRSEGRSVGERWEPIWQIIVLIAVALFVVDIATRRLAVSTRARIVRFRT